MAFVIYVSIWKQCVPVRCTHWNIYEESNVYGTKSIKNKVEAGKWNTIWIIIRIVTNHGSVVTN
jgi:hypothetical protein